jgi:VanZ family protein
MIMRIVFVVYWIYLSILLFSQDPTRWVGTPGSVPEFLKMLMPYAHIISFTVLSFLTFAAYLPLPWWGILLTLAIYGGATEIIQGRVPHRTPDWADWFQDLSGVAIGFACFWFLVFLMRIRRRNESLEAPSSS